MKEKTPIMQMYYGQRGVCDKIPLQEEYFRLMDEHSEKKRIFKDALSDELSTLYDEIDDIKVKMEDLDDEATYGEGFRFGVLMGLDIGKPFRPDKPE